MVPNGELRILILHTEPPKRGQPGQDVWSQGVIYMEVPLYCKKQ